MELERLHEDARSGLSPAFDVPGLGQFDRVPATS